MDEAPKCDYFCDSYWTVLYLFCDAVYYVVQGGECVNQTLNCDHSNESLTEQHFPVALFTILYKVVLPFESVDEILKFDHTNESF